MKVTQSKTTRKTKRKVTGKPAKATRTVSNGNKVRKRKRK